MRVARVLALGLLVSGAAGVLSAQIPTRKPSSRGGEAHRRPVCWSATRIRLPRRTPPTRSRSVTAMRARMDKLASGQFRVLTQEEMNEALKQFGYPSDAILSPVPLRCLCAVAERTGAGRLHGHP